MICRMFLQIFYDLKSKSPHFIQTLASKTIFKIEFEKKTMPVNLQKIGNSEHTPLALHNFCLHFLKFLFSISSFSLLLLFNFMVRSGKITETLRTFRKENCYAVVGLVFENFFFSSSSIQLKFTI